MSLWLLLLKQTFLVLLIVPKWKKIWATVLSGKTYFYVPPGGGTEESDWWQIQSLVELTKFKDFSLTKEFNFQKSKIPAPNDRDPIAKTAQLIQEGQDQGCMPGCTAAVWMMLLAPGWAPHPVLIWVLLWSTGWVLVWGYPATKQQTWSEWYQSTCAGSEVCILSILDAEVLVLLIHTLGTIWLPTLCLSVLSKSIRERVQMILSGAVSALGNTGVLLVEEQRSYLKAGIFAGKFQTRSWI